MAKKRRSLRQTGRTTKSRDRKLKAKKPGFRPSKSGGYTERRANRSDKAGPKARKGRRL